MESPKSVLFNWILPFILVHIIKACCAHQQLSEFIVNVESYICIHLSVLMQPAVGGQQGLLYPL